MGATIQQLEAAAREGEAYAGSKFETAAERRVREELELLRKDRDRDIAETDAKIKRRLECEAADSPPVVADMTVIEGAAYARHLRRIKLEMQAVQMLLRVLNYGTRISADDTMLTVTRGRDGVFRHRRLAHLPGCA